MNNYVVELMVEFYEQTYFGRKFRDFLTKYPPSIERDRKYYLHVCKCIYYEVLRELAGDNTCEQTNEKINELLMKIKFKCEPNTENYKVWYITVPLIAKTVNETKYALDIMTGQGDCGTLLANVLSIKLEK